MKLKKISAVLAAMLCMCNASVSVPMTNIAGMTAIAASNAASIQDIYMYIAYEDYVEITATAAQATGDLIVPDEIDGLPVKVIGEHAFASNSMITSVTLPDTVTSIGKQAFYQDTGLQSVTIPDGVTEIGDETFLSCSQLTAIDLPETITGIGTRAFYGCSSLTEITLPSDLTTLGEYALQDCTGLTEITLPDGLTELADGVLMGCTGITELTLPENILSTGMLSIPNSVEILIVWNPECEIHESFAYKSEDVIQDYVIVSYADSKAQAFAEEYGFTFALLSSCGTSEYHVSDVIALHKYLLGKASLENWEFYDLNNDNILNIYDCILLKKILLEQNTAQSVTYTYTATALSSAYTANTVTGAEADESFIMGQTKFALELLQNAVSESEGENILISPYSVVQALGMTANGAAGDTRTQMEQVLGGMDISKLNAYLFTQRTSQPDESYCKLSTANSIWFRDDAERLSVNEDFLQTNADYYGASVFKAAFDDSTVTDINTWVNENTDGMIPKLLDEISAEAVMYLINAVAFDAKWQTPYSTYDVYDRDFTAYDGTLQTAQMMSSTEYNYLEDENATGFYKYYQGGRYAFAALLPNEDISVTEYVQSLTPESLYATLSNPQEVSVYARLPKFSYDYDILLNKSLADMGMPDAFNDETADFSNMAQTATDILYISKVLHKTHIDVDEEGTKAAAVTEVDMNDCTSIDPGIPVILDRPFVYCIVDTETYLPIFIGVLDEIPE